MELDKLYQIYQANIKVDQMPVNENMSTIKVGDILVAVYNNREVKGEVSAVYENYYVLRGKNDSTIKVTLDDITEHYPKNTSFENKNAVRKFTESTFVEAPKKEKPNDKSQIAKKRILDDAEKDELENSPENQVDLSIENVKTIGKVAYYTDVKYSDVNKMFEMRLLSKEEIWYLVTEKPNEIHVIKNNEKAFQIQPFVNALVGHFMKSQDKLIQESFGKMKVSGNNDFSIVTNVPQNVQKQLLNSLIGLLSEIKK